MTGVLDRTVAFLTTGVHGTARRLALAAVIVLIGFALANHAMAAGAVTADVPAISISEPGTPSAHCTSTATLDTSTSADAACGAINLFGNGRALQPGGSHRITMRVGSVGSTRIGSLSLVTGTCAQLDRSRHAVHGGLCGAFRLTVETITSGGTRSVAISNTALGRLPRTPIQIPAPSADGGPETVRLTLTLDRGAAVRDLGDSVSQSVRWQASA